MFLLSALTRVSILLTSVVFVSYFKIKLFFKTKRFVVVDEKLPGVVLIFE
jgi:hypothetical protein